MFIYKKKIQAKIIEKLNVHCILDSFLQLNFFNSRNIYILNLTHTHIYVYVCVCVCVCVLHRKICKQLYGICIIFMKFLRITWTDIPLAQKGDWEL